MNEYVSNILYQSLVCLMYKIITMICIVLSVYIYIHCDAIEYRWWWCVVERKEKEKKERKKCIVSVEVKYKSCASSVYCILDIYPNNRLLIEKKEKRRKKKTTTIITYIINESRCIHHCIYMHNYTLTSNNFSLCTLSTFDKYSIKKKEQEIEGKKIYAKLFLKNNHQR